jgi:uncharacterized protein (TIGR00369 family)
MVYDMIRRRMSDILPFNTFVGVEIVSLADGVAEARLPFRTEVTNHIGTMHAAALFTVAEAASGAAVSGAFAPVIVSVKPVAAKATIEYLKIAKATVTARAKTVEPPADLRDRLHKDGRVAFDVVVDVAEVETSVARMVVGWHVAKKK